MFFKSQLNGDLINGCFSFASLFWRQTTTSCSYDLLLQYRVPSSKAQFECNLLSEALLLKLGCNFVAKLHQQKEQLLKKHEFMFSAQR